MDRSCGPILGLDLGHLRGVLETRPMKYSHIPSFYQMNPRNP